MPSFNYSGTIVTFAWGHFNESRSLVKIQPKEQSAIGVRFGQAAYGKDDVLSLTMQLTRAEFLAVRFFLNTTVNGSGRVFTYTDGNGVAYNVRYLGGQLTESETEYNLYTPTIRLRVE